MNIELELEEDGRWIAEGPDLPGVMTYGKTREEAISRVKALALRVLADRVEHGEEVSEVEGVRGIGMSRWPSTKARLVLAALLRIGWSVKRESGTSHRVLSRSGWPDFIFAFHSSLVDFGTWWLQLPLSASALLLADPASEVIEMKHNAGVIRP